MTTRAFVAGASLLGGLLAGADLDRALVANPAWRHLGPLAWAAFSRNADLSLQGLALYPILGIGGALFALAAAISLMRARHRPRAAIAPIYITALLTVGGLLATAQAAPIMLGIAHLGQDQVSLSRAMDGFERWGNIRAILQILAFVTSLWALAALREAP